MASAHGGLVRSRRDGKHVLYRLADGPTVEAMTVLRAIAERNLAEVREAATAFARDLDALEPITRAECCSGSTMAVPFSSTCDRATSIGSATCRGP
jgi:CTP:molybdopterin cytidylyltransferase MocA